MAAAAGGRDTAEEGAAAATEAAATEAAATEEEEEEEAVGRSMHELFAAGGVTAAPAATPAGTVEVPVGAVPSPLGPSERESRLEGLAREVLAAWCLATSSARAAAGASCETIVAES